MNVVQSMINGAERNILITGYSLSSYFSELVDTIILKSQRGVFVKFFVNGIDKQPGFDKILRYKGRFLKIYNYHQEDDKMAALHAKVISVEVDEEEKSASVVVPDFQLSLAIGKEGQNARLAARLTGYKIDIKSEPVSEEA